jgi:hypothetical protein
MTKNQDTRWNLGFQAKFESASHELNGNGINEVESLKYRSVSSNHNYS